MYTVTKDGVPSGHNSEQDVVKAAHWDYRAHKSVIVLDTEGHRVWYSELSRDGRTVLVWSRKRETL